MIVITPEQLAASGTEDGHQSALFCYAQLRATGKLSAGKWVNVTNNFGTDSYQQMKPAEPLWALLYAIPNGGNRTAATGARMKATGTKPGFPDVGLPVARGGCSALFIEMKIEKYRNDKNGGCSDLQLEWHAALEAERNYVVICYSWQEAVKMIDWYLQLTMAYPIWPPQR